MNDFLKELEALFRKYDASISFDPDTMDTHGSGRSGLELSIHNGKMSKTVRSFPYCWSLSAGDLKRLK